MAVEETVEWALQPPSVLNYQDLFRSFPNRQLKLVGDGDGHEHRVMCFSSWEEFMAAKEIFRSANNGGGSPYRVFSVLNGTINLELLVY